MAAINNIQNARDALQFFHNAAIRYPENYRLTFQQLIDKINADSPKFMDSLGSSLTLAKVTQTQVRTGMEALANEGKGKIPAHYGDFFNFVVDRSRSVSFVSVVASAVGDSAAIIGRGAVGVGENAVGGINTILKIAPWVLAAGVLLFVYMESKSLAKAIKLG